MHLLAMIFQWDLHIRVALFLKGKQLILSFIQEKLIQ